MKLFLSLPMNGRTDEVIQSEIDKMTVLALDNRDVFDLKPGEDLVCVDNFSYKPEILKIIDENGFYADDIVSEGLLYLAGAVNKMAFCNGILFHPNFASARGCRAEYEIAKLYDIPCYAITLMDKEEVKELG